MAYVSWLNRTIFTAASAGTSAFTVATAATGYITPASAGVTDQLRLRYAAETTNGSGAVTAWEVGTGTYTVSTTSLSRTVLFSSNSNSAVNFATAPTVMITALSGDFSSQLDANTEFYVATTGSDTTGNGTIGLPWATLQKAYNTIIHFDLNGFSANINIANGTYAAITMQLGNGTGTINFIGASAAGVIINPSFATTSGVCFQVGATNFTNLSIGIQDLTMSGTGVETGILASGAGSVVSLYGDVFFTSLAKDVWASQDSSVYSFASSITITGNAVTPFLIEDGSSFVNHTTSIVCVSTPAWSNAFAEVNDSSLFETENVTITFTGTATGKRFIVGTGGVINTGTNNLSYFPGDVAGDILTGGQYDNISGSREVLIQNRDYYVATTGSDTANTGLTVGSPFATIQHAINVAAKLDLGDFRVVIHVADGSYPEFIMIGPTVSNKSYGDYTVSPLEIAGNDVTPANVVINPSTTVPANIYSVVTMTGPGGCYFHGFKIDGTNASGCDLTYAIEAGILYLDAIDFGTCQNSMMDTFAKGLVYLVGAISTTISGNATTALASANEQSSILFLGGPIDIPATVSISSVFFCTDGGQINIQNPITFTGVGTITGKQFQLRNGGYLTSLTTVIPASLPGELDTGSRFNGTFGESSYTVANLPSAAVPFITVGTRSFVTDALNPVNGEIVTGGGAIKCEVYSNGTNWIATGLPTRELLTADRTYYVRTDGSDSNTGLANTAGGAWLTPQHAYDVIVSTLDLAGFTINVQIADGTYSTLTSIPTAGTAVIVIDKGWTGGGVVNFNGNLTTPGNVVFQNSGGAPGSGVILLSSHGPINGNLTFDGIKITSNAVGSYGIGHFMSGYALTIGLNGWEFGAVTGPHMLVSAPGAEIQTDGNYTISGGATNHILVQVQGFAYLSTAVTLTGTPNFSDAFFSSILGSIIWNDGATYTGAATGKRFNVDSTSKISTNGSGLTYLPGDVAGTIEFGGFYDEIAGGNITGGFTVTPGNGGTLTTGQTFTATAINGNYQYYTNNGAHTFANPSADCAIDVLVTNATNAGAITFSTFTVGTTGDALTTTNGNKFIISTRRINGTSTYLVKALQ